MLGKLNLLLISQTTINTYTGQISIQNANISRTKFALVWLECNINVGQSILEIKISN